MISKGLEAFDEVVGIIEFCDGITSSEIEKARQNMDYIEKELEALEIIRKKRVNIPMFYEFVNIADKTFACDRYNQEVDEETLTQGEFDSLVEVLVNE